MKLMNITAHNFLSYEDLSLDLDNQGLVLLDGKTNDALDGTFESNSSGKSSLLGAIFYAIYGETPDGRSANNVINRDKGKDTKVTLIFSINKHTYRIERGRKKNFIKLFEDEDELTYSTMKETQQAIESLVAIPEEVFRTTLFFDGHYTTPFSEMTDKQKKDFLSAIVDLDVYSRAHDKTKEDIKGINTEIDKIDYKITINEQHNQANNQAIESNKQRLTILNQQLETANANLNHLIEKQTQSDYSQLSYLEQELADFTISQKHEAKDKYDKLSSEVNKANASVYEANSNLSSLQSNIKSIQQAVKQYQETYLNYKELASKAYDRDNLGEAYQLGTVANESGLDQIIPNAFDNTKITEVQGKLASLVSQYKEAKEQETQAQQAYQEAQENLAQITPQLEAQQALVNEEAKVNQTQMSKYQALNQQINTLRSAKQKQDNQYNQYKAQVADLNNQITYVTQQLETLTPATTDEIDKLRLDKEQLVNNRIKLEHALDAFSDKGIKSHVLDLVTPTLNEGVNKYLSILTGGIISAEFSTQTKKSDGTFSDKLDIVIHHSGEDTTYSSLSSGEKRRVDIAISLALQDMVMTRFGNDINLLAYDELFESLDAVGSENVVELLRQKLADVSTIIVISHNEDLKPLFDKTILVTKEKGISTLKVIS